VGARKEKEKNGRGGGWGGVGFFGKKVARYRGEKNIEGQAGQGISPEKLNLSLKLRQDK